MPENSNVVMQHRFDWLRAGVAGLVGPILIAAVWMVRTEPRLQAIENNIIEIKINHTDMGKSIGIQGQRLHDADDRMTEQLTRVREQLARVEARQDAVLLNISSILGILHDRSNNERRAPPSNGGNPPP